MSDQLLERIAAVVDGAGDADDVLRGVVGELAAAPAVSWAGISFLEGGRFEPGPDEGEPAPAARTSVPVSWQGTVVGELAVDGEVAPEVLETIASQVSAYVLLGWDTGGEPWEP
jgi:hypothetical protein